MDEDLSINITNNQSNSRNATSKIAARIGGEDPKKTESELLSKLLGLKDLKSSGSLQ